MLFCLKICHKFASIKYPLNISKPADKIAIKGGWSGHYLLKVSMWPPKKVLKVATGHPNVHSPVCCVTASYLTRNFSLKREQMISHLRIILSHHWSHWRKKGKNQIIFPSFRHFSQALQNVLCGSPRRWWNEVDEVEFFDKGSFQNRHSTL